MENLTIKTALENALPVLSELINQELGFAPELFLAAKNGGFIIASEDLLSELGNTLSKTLFTSIKIRMWGEIDKESNIIWFNTKLAYEHPNGGENGTSLIWQAIWFDYKEAKWIPGNKLI